MKMQFFFANFKQINDFHLQLNQLNYLGWARKCTYAAIY